MYGLMCKGKTGIKRKISGMCFRFQNMQVRGTRKDWARPTFFQISCYLCCSVVICVVLCTVYVEMCTVLLPPGVCV
jgi:hypothetical protein